MLNNTIFKKKLASDWFSSLQKIMCSEFEKIERDYGKLKNKKCGKFKKNLWNKSKKLNEGGGVSFIMKNGLVFEKIGINFSKVSGVFDERFKNKILGAKKNPKYWASGISLVAHMKNPKIPALHFNTRYIVTKKDWFGGGMDATPCVKDEKEKKYFLNKIRTMCNKHNKKYFKLYNRWCNEYFFNSHRNEPRGIGGIFFDYKNSSWENDFLFVRDVGICFLECAINIIRKKYLRKWNKREKKLQLLKRGRYVEFNLLHDRGTKFGLSTGGNVDAIFMSLPPSAEWK
jgi:coproporphyrinogen III oxidase